VKGHPDAAGQAPRDKAKSTEKQSLKPGQIDVEKSRVFILVGKKGLGHEHGVEGKIKSGTINLKAEKDVGEIEFDMTSFAADTDRARKYVGLEESVSASTRRKVSKTMLGPDVLDVEEFPKATFTIESALHKKTKQGRPVVELKGEFTLHGKTRPLTLQAEPSQKEGHWNLRGDFTIRQTDFGITPYSAALGTIGVADQLKIFGDLWITDEGTTPE
jgi:polyisoprenoid-binding protein YceI